jgi:hypothetical protein
VEVQTQVCINSNSKVIIHYEDLCIIFTCRACWKQEGNGIITSSTCSKNHQNILSRRQEFYMTITVTFQNISFCLFYVGKVWPFEWFNYRLNTNCIRILLKETSSPTLCKYVHNAGAIWHLGKEGKWTYTKLKLQCYPGIGFKLYPLFLLKI